MTILKKCIQYLSGSKIIKLKCLKTDRPSFKPDFRSFCKKERRVFRNARGTKTNAFGDFFLFLKNYIYIYLFFAVSSRSLELNGVPLTQAQE